MADCFAICTSEKSIPLNRLLHNLGLGGMSEKCSSGSNATFDDCDMKKLSSMIRLRESKNLGALRKIQSWAK